MLYDYVSGRDDDCVRDDDHGGHGDDHGVNDQWLIRVVVSIIAIVTYRSIVSSSGAVTLSNSS